LGLQMIWTTVGEKINKKYSELKVLLRIWMKRLITPLGRVAVLKFLVLSKFIHL